MATDKQRVTLYLTKWKYARMQQAAARIPGASVSGLVEDLMLQPIEYLLSLLDEADAGSRDAKAEIFAVAQESGWDRILDGMIREHMAKRKGDSKKDQ